MLFRLTVVLFRNSFCRFWWGPGLVYEEVIKWGIFFFCCTLTSADVVSSNFQPFQHIFALVWWNKISWLCRGEGWQAEGSQLSIPSLAENLICSCGSIPVGKGLGHSHGWALIPSPPVPTPGKCHITQGRATSLGSASGTQCSLTLMAFTQRILTAPSLGMKAGMPACLPGFSPLAEVSSSLLFLGGFPEHCHGWQRVEGGEGQQVLMSSTGMAVGMTDTQPRNSSQICLRNTLNLSFSLRMTLVLQQPVMLAESWHHWTSAQRAQLQRPRVFPALMLSFWSLWNKKGHSKTMLCMSMGNHITFWSRNKNESSLDENCVWVHCCWSIICICVFFISLGEQWCSLSPWIRMFLSTFQLESY